MRSLKLYFPYHKPQITVIDYALLLIGIVLLLAAAYQAKQLMMDITYWEARETRILQQQKNSRQSSAPIARIHQATQQEIQQMNNVLQQLNLPWEKLFNSLEMADNKDIALLSLQPSVSGQTIHMTGEARHIVALVEYVQALEWEPTLKHAHLVSYKTRQDHPSHPIVFSIMATWYALL